MTIENRTQVRGMRADSMITRIEMQGNSYEVEAIKRYSARNPEDCSMSLVLGNGQSSIEIYPVGKGEALQFFKEFWTNLESRGKDFNYNQELPRLWEPEGL